MMQDDGDLPLLDIHDAEFGLNVFQPNSSGRSVAPMPIVSSVGNSSRHSPFHFSTNGHEQGNQYSNGYGDTVTIHPPPNEFHDVSMETDSTAGSVVGWATHQPMPSSQVPFKAEYQQPFHNGTNNFTHTSKRHSVHQPTHHMQQQQQPLPQTNGFGNGFVQNPRGITLPHLMQAQLENQMLQQQLQQQIAQLQQANVAGIGHLGGHPSPSLYGNNGMENPFLYNNQQGGLLTNEQQHIPSRHRMSGNSHPHQQMYQHMMPSPPIHHHSRNRPPSLGEVSSVTAHSEVMVETKPIIKTKHSKVHPPSPPMEEPLKWTVGVQMKGGEKAWNVREVDVPLSTSFTDLLYLVTNVRAYVGLSIEEEQDVHKQYGEDTQLSDHPFIHSIAKPILLKHQAELEANKLNPLTIPKPKNTVNLGVVLSYDLGPNIKSCTRLGCPRLLLKKASRRACDHCQLHGYELDAKQIRVLYLQEPIVTTQGKLFVEQQAKDQMAAAATTTTPVADFSTLTQTLTSQLRHSGNHSASLASMLDRSMSKIEYWKFESSDSNQIFLAFATEEQAMQAQLAFEKLERCASVSTRGRMRNTSVPRSLLPGGPRVTSPLSNESVPSVGLTHPDSEEDGTRHRTRSATGRNERSTSRGKRENGEAGGQMASNGANVSSPTVVGDGILPPATLTTTSASSRSSAQTASASGDHSKSHSGHSGGHSRSTSHSALGELAGLDTDDSMVGPIGHLPNDLGVVGGTTTTTADGTQSNGGSAGQTGREGSEDEANMQPSLVSHLAPAPSHLAYTVRMKSHFWKLEVRPLDAAPAAAGSKNVVHLFKKLGKPNQKRGHGPEPPISTVNRILSAVGRARVSRRVAGAAAGGKDTAFEPIPGSSPNANSAAHTLHAMDIDNGDGSGVMNGMDDELGVKQEQKMDMSSSSNITSDVPHKKRRHSQVASSSASQTSGISPTPLDAGCHSSLPFSAGVSTATASGSAATSPMQGVATLSSKFRNGNGTAGRLPPTGLHHGNSNQVLVSGESFERMKHQAVSATMQVTSTTSAAVSSSSSSLTGGDSTVTTTTTTRQTPVLLIYRDRNQLHADLASGYLGDAPSSSDEDPDSRNSRDGSGGSGSGGNGGDDAHDPGYRSDSESRDRDEQESNKRRKVDTQPGGRQQAGGPASNSSARMSAAYANEFLLLPSVIRVHPPSSPMVGAARGRVSLLREEKSASLDSSGGEDIDSQRRGSSSFSSENQVTLSHGARRPGFLSPSSPSPQTQSDEDLALQLASQEEEERVKRSIIQGSQQGHQEDEQKQDVVKKTGRTEQAELGPLPDWLIQPTFGSKIWRMMFAFGWGPIVLFTLLILMGGISLVFLGANIASAGGLAAGANSAPLQKLHLFTYGQDPSVREDMFRQREGMVRDLVWRMRSTSAVFNLWAMQVEQPIVIYTPPNSLQSLKTRFRTMAGGPSMHDEPPFDPDHHLIGNNTNLIRNDTVSDEAVAQLQNVSFISHRCNEISEASRALANWLLFSSEMGTKSTLVPYGTMQPVYQISPVEFCRRMDHTAGRQILYRQLCTSMGNSPKVRPYCAKGDTSGFGGESCVGIVQFLLAMNITAPAFQWPTVDRSTPSLEISTEANAWSVGNSYLRGADLLSTQCGYFTSIMQNQASDLELSSVQQSPSIHMDGTVLAVLLFGAIGMVTILVTVILACVWFAHSRLRPVSSPPRLSDFTAHRYRHNQPVQVKDELTSSAGQSRPSLDPLEASILPLRPTPPITPANTIGAGPVTSAHSTPLPRLSAATYANVSQIEMI